jgi:hypothetical protein
VLRALEFEPYDVVITSEVIKHVVDRVNFVADLRVLVALCSSFRGGKIEHTFYFFCCGRAHSSLTCRVRGLDGSSSSSVV